MSVTTKDVDELINEMLALKKKGLPKMLERGKRSEKVSSFYRRMLAREMETLRNRIIRNMDFLGNHFNIHISDPISREYMGLAMPVELDELTRGKDRKLNLLESAVIIGLFYGIDPAMVLSEDLSADFDLSATYSARSVFAKIDK